MDQEGLNRLLSRYLTIGIVAGALLGAAIGALTGGYDFWVGLGVLAGIVIATIAIALRSERGA